MQEIGRHITDDLKFLYITSVDDDGDVTVSKYELTLKQVKKFAQTT